MVGGTFDPIHDGHKLLLTRSFELAGEEGKVVIGLTTDLFDHRKGHPVRPYLIRKRGLEEFIKSRGFAASYSIEPLQDKYGSAIDVDFDALVVSEETLPVAIEINARRREGRKKKVDIHQITCVMAEDGKRISSTRIYKGEIDIHGRLMK